MTARPSPVRTRRMLDAWMETVREAAFPQYAGCEASAAEAEMERRLAELTGGPAAATFREAFPELRRQLAEDVAAIAANDPAATSLQEIVYCYPAVTAMLHYRCAHQLLSQGIEVLPRMLTEAAHSATGIDIHPAARIGKHFAIDHGTGVVIGETAVIGDHVTLYQGVTLGAKNFRYDPDGRPVNLPRHPILEDGVTVYANASILGRVTIGKGAVIGGNVWLTRSVPPGARILQGKTQELFSDGAGI